MLLMMAMAAAFVLLIVKYCSISLIPPYGHRLLVTEDGEEGIKSVEEGGLEWDGTQQSKGNDTMEQRQEGG